MLSVVVHCVAVCGVCAVFYCLFVVCPVSVCCRGIVCVVYVLYVRGVCAHCVCFEISGTLNLIYYPEPHPESYVGFERCSNGFTSYDK